MVPIRKLLNQKSINLGQQINGSSKISMRSNVAEFEMRYVSDTDT